MVRVRVRVRVRARARVRVRVRVRAAIRASEIGEDMDELDGRRVRV